RAGAARAAGLALACRVLGGGAPLGDLRLDHNALHTGMIAVRSGRCDRAMVRSIRDQIAELRVALTSREQDAVATVIAATIWGVRAASARAPAGALGAGARGAEEGAGTLSSRGAAARMGVGVAPAVPRSAEENADTLGSPWAAARMGRSRARRPA